MKRFTLIPTLLLGLTATLQAQESGAPIIASTFRMEELGEKLEVGYAVILADVNGDGKKDIVVVDTNRVLWFENPTWKKHLIIEGGTKKDNVCIDAYDIDGDGQNDFALGADWKPFNTNSGGTLQWLKRGKSLDEPWQIFPIDSEPTVHRIRFVDIDGTGKPALVLAPLMGRGSSKDANWLDGTPVHLTAYRIPKNPEKERWIPEVLDANLHVVHNLWPVPRMSGSGQDVLCASYEGITLLKPVTGKWHGTLLGAGNQENPKGSRGASEIKMGKLKNGKRFLATIEPWHGHEVVVYTEPLGKGKLWDRHVLDAQLRWGHAVWTADLDGDGSDEVIIGVRDDLDKKNQRRGVRLYKAIDTDGSRWTRQILDNGGIAVEDLTVGDLNGDGRPDIIAVGRQTHNIRIYWNEGSGSSKANP
jgi:hypothetical protein